MPYTQPNVEIYEMKSCMKIFAITVRAYGFVVQLPMVWNNINTVLAHLHNIALMSIEIWYSMRCTRGEVVF